MYSNQSYRVYLRVILKILFFNLLLGYCSSSASGFVVIGGRLRSANNEFFIKEIPVLFGKIIICESKSSRRISIGLHCHISNQLLLMKCARLQNYTWSRTTFEKRMIFCPKSDKYLRQMKGAIDKVGRFYYITALVMDCKTKTLQTYLSNKCVLTKLYFV